MDVQVRLWQDPISSVINGQFYDRVENLTNGMPVVKDHGKVLVLLAQVDLEMTAEQIESRRRERYATLAALSTAGYVPVESERISYVDFRRPLVKAPPPPGTFHGLGAGA